jgi:hypothetical protein
MKSFNFKKLNDVEAWKQNQVKISNRFAALDNLDGNVNINWALDGIKENIKSSSKTV